MEHLGEIPRHSFLDPRLYNSTNFYNNSIKIDEDKNREIIDKWLLEKGKFQINFFPVHKPRSDFSLNSAKHGLKNCLAIIEKLQKTQDDLRNNVDKMSSQEWKQKTLDIASFKDEFDKLMMPFEDNTVLKSLKGTIIKRSKKRINLKKRKKALQEFKKFKEDKRVEIDKSIDRWLESKKEEVERVKMEEKMKKDADCVLYEVTKKKSEARKQLSLISALVKLRTVRDSMATQRGEKLSLEDRKAFGLVTEKLIRMWENSYQNYCKEEQCLNVMLENNATADTQALLTAKQRKISEEWENLIFGSRDDVTPQNPIYWALTSADRDLESFIAIRKSWDTFLSTPENSVATAIPLGWILPPTTPNENWTPYLKND